jgi:predicted nucleotidyltransferase
MIADADRRTIVETAAEYGVKRVLLFGSSLSADAESRDIDIAIDGIEDKDFFAFYGDLICRLSKPVDVVDLSAKSLFTEIIEREGMALLA